MKKILVFFYFSAIILLFTGCYRNKARELPSPDTTAVKYVAPQIDTVVLKQKRDSLLFLAQHHYTENFNFVVRADSICLYKQQPEEVVSQLVTDSFYVYKNDPLVVADIRMMPADPVDSVWVNVDPDDPISQFITVFSNNHLLIFLVVLIFIGVAYMGRIAIKRNAKIVHFNDIPTPGFRMGYHHRRIGGCRRGTQESPARRSDSVSLWFGWRLCN